MTFRFDRRNLVGPPFITCPKCRAVAFGIYHVAGHSYSRRCRECWNGGEFPLWPLDRKVIYIDQFAISDMMKALNRAHPSHERAATNPFWVTLFERLERVVKLRLAVCPYSDMHRHESLMLGRFYEPLKTMYEHLSDGVSFESPDVIAQRQLNTALLAWLKNEAPQYDFRPERVIHGGLNEWKANYAISVSGEYPQFIIDAIRKFRDEVYAKIRTLFEEELRTTPHTDFEYWLNRERQAAGRAIVQAQQLWLQRVRDMRTGLIPYSPDSLYNSTAFEQSNLIHEVLKGNVGEEEVEQRFAAFLDSDAFKDYPSSRIATLVWAAIGRAAAGGQKEPPEPPNPGMSNDIRVLTLAPYCDAMFVDSGCRGLWEKIPKRYRPSYRVKLFSSNTRDQFLAYLEEVEAQGDPAVIACAREVYGEPEPFLTVYE